MLGFIKKNNEIYRIKNDIDYTITEIPIEHSGLAYYDDKFLFLIRISENRIYVYVYNNQTKTYNYLTYLTGKKVLDISTNSKYIVVGNDSVQSTSLTVYEFNSTTNNFIQIGNAISNITCISCSISHDGTKLILTTGIPSIVGYIYNSPNWNIAFQSSSNLVARYVSSNFSYIVSDTNTGGLQQIYYWNGSSNIVPFKNSLQKTVLHSIISNDGNIYIDVVHDSNNSSFFHEVCVYLHNNTSSWNLISRNNLHGISISTTLTNFHLKPQHASIMSDKVFLLGTLFKLNHLFDLEIISYFNKYILTSSRYTYSYKDHLFKNNTLINFKLFSTDQINKVIRSDILVQ